MAVFREIRVVLLGQYDEIRLGAEEPGVVEASTVSLGGRKGGKTGLAGWRGERLPDSLRGTSREVLLRVRVLPDELDCRE